MVVAVIPEQSVRDEVLAGVDHVDDLVAVETWRGREHDQLEPGGGSGEELQEVGPGLDVDRPPANLRHLDLEHPVSIWHELETAVDQGLVKVEDQGLV